LNKKTIGIARSVSNIGFILKKVLKYSPKYFWSELFINTIESIQNFIEFTVTVKIILDAIQYQKPFSGVAVYMGILFVCIIIRNCITFSLPSYVIPKSMEKAKFKIKQELYEKAISIDLACYDDPEFYNTFVWSINEAGTRVETIVQKTTDFIGSMVFIILSGAFILTLNPIGSIFAMSAFALTVVTNLKINKIKYTKDLAIMADKRKRSYFNRVFYLADYAKEIRLSDIGRKLKNDFTKSNEDITETIKKYSLRQMIYSFIKDFVCNNLIVDGLYMIYLVYQVIVVKSLSYGSMLAVFRATNNFTWTMVKITRVLPELHIDAMYIEKIREFTDYEIKIKSPQNGKTVPKELSTIEFKNVSFSYTDNEKVLDNISFKIKAKDKIAIVGYNGSGKTTLIKLLMRLYDPLEGEILLDGINIKEYLLNEYRNMIGTVFQDYQIFAAQLNENIVMDIPKEDDKETREILYALEKSGFPKKHSQMKNGLKTSLTREFDDEGVNLSGGESQKVAVSRAYYKNGNFLVMDEPSSALDPISEYNLNQSMLNESQNKTIIFISHRLATTRMADKIYMFEKGRIIEQGSHDDLIRLNKKYYEMFTIQAEMYRK
jgi:ATP-binding cassette, subfamily B, bacterial